MWDRDEMRREGACEVGGKWDATCEASRQPSVFMLTNTRKPLGSERELVSFERGVRLLNENAEGTYKTKHAEAARLIYTTTTHGHIDT